MKAKEYKRTIREKQIENHFKNPLDPLILRLSKDYINDADLSNRLDELFKVPSLGVNVAQKLFILNLDRAAAREREVRAGRMVVDSNVAV